MTILAEISSSWAAALVLAGMIALVFTLGRLLRRHAARGDAGAGPALPSTRTVADADARLRETAERLASDIETLGREARGAVETRVRVLSELLARADQVLERLEGAEPVPPPPRFEEVYRLSDEGLDAAGIAERTSFERGEVELILGTRTRTTASGRLERVPPPRPEDPGGERA